MSDATRSLNPQDVAGEMPNPTIALCADCVDAYRNGIEPGGTACESREHGESILRDRAADAEQDRAELIEALEDLVDRRNDYPTDLSPTAREWDDAFARANRLLARIEKEMSK